MNQGSKIQDNEGFNRAIEYVGGKWKLQILWSLKNGPLRFTALKDSLAPITQKMLATALKELEADGLVFRHVFSVVPPRVEYSVTPLFGNLGEALELISLWGNTTPNRKGNSIPEAQPEILTPEVELTATSEISPVTPVNEVPDKENPAQREEPQEQELEQHQKRESFLKKNEKNSRISNLFK